MNAIDDTLNKRFRLEVYNSITTPWSSISSDILRIENYHFGENALDESALKADFEDDDSVAILVRENSNSAIIGFTYAEPADSLYRSDIHYAIRLTEIKSLSGKVAYISDLALDPSYIGLHLTGIILGLLEETLIAKGYYYLDIDAVEANNFAANFKKMNYSEGRIVKEELHDSEYGPQVFFRIRLE